MTQDLVQFDELKEMITVGVAPALTIQVSDFASSQQAIEAGKTIKALINKVDQKRKEMVKPLNDRVKLINNYAADIEQPLLRAEQHIKKELQKFAEIQEVKRQEELKRIEEQKREAERKAAEERRKLEEELQAKRDAELRALEAKGETESEAASLFGSDEPLDPAKAEADRIAIEIRLEQERAEVEARLEQERINQKIAHQGQEWDAKQMQIKNARKVWKCELVDISLVPREFLIITLNQSAVLAAARGGVKEIPGVRIFQEINVAFGRNTYVPSLALESEG